MQSLRSRPSQAPRKVQRSKLSKNVSLRDSKKSRVDDKIKKRMSMRYAQISGPTELNDVPPVPGFVGSASTSQRGAASMKGDEDIADSLNREGKASVEDMELLSIDDFDPDVYLKLKLANSTEAELRSLQSSLFQAKEDTAVELQRSVFKNYAEFVLISKEISVLENEMLELKDLLSEYKSMPSMLHIPDPTSAPNSILSTYKRSSVADLRILYFNQMQSLHATIEGAVKFVPTTPGRHVVGELDGVVNLNTATYKVVGKVKFVVLDDAVLVARRRRRNGGEGGGSAVNDGKLVAEKCWALNEMLVLDTKDSSKMTNVFKIKQGKETNVYRTESAAEKKNLLSLFRQVADELAAKRRKEREGEHERRKSMWQGGMAVGQRNSVIPPLPEWMADLARRGGDIPGMGDGAKEKAERDTRWVGEWSDNLTVSIALKEWDKAVELVEQGQAKLPANPLIATKLPSLKAELTSALLSALSLQSNRKTTVVKLISLLNQLKAGVAACTTFLNMRSEVLRATMRKIRFEGHIGSYIGDLSVVYFTGIKHTADWYLASFKENEVASAFISWAKLQIETFASVFRKQVYTKDVDPKIVEDARNITLLQSRKLLQEYGLDFRFLLHNLLLENPQEYGTPQPKFSIQAHRTSKQLAPAAAAKNKKEIQSPPLLSTPTPPSIPTVPQSPIRRRPSPAPSTVSTSSNPLSIADTDSLHPPLSTSAKTSRIINGLNLSQHSISSIQNEAPHSAERTPYGNGTSSPVSSRPPYTAGYPARSRTPVPAAATPPPRPSTPVSAPIIPPSSPIPRYTRTPPASAAPLRNGVIMREADRADWSEDKSGMRDRPQRDLRSSPVPRSPAPPPRSINRPGSITGPRSRPVAVPQHDGMI